MAIKQEISIEGLSRSVETLLQEVAVSTQEIKRLQQLNNNLVFELQSCLQLIGHLSQAMQITHLDPAITSQLSRLQVMKTRNH